MVDLISVLKDWSWFIEWLLYGLVVIFAENKLNIVNRIRKQIARALNKFTEISITLQYTTNKDFEL